MAKNLVLAKAQNAVLAHDWVTAARLYKELLQGNEKNVDYLMELGSIYVKAGEDEKAIPYFQQIITCYPHYIDAMNNLGAIFRRLKRYDESIAILKKAKSEGRDSGSVNYNLGFTYKEMKKYEEAIDSFELVIVENPDDVLAYNHLGSIYYAQKNYDKSISSFKRGLQVDPNHPILNYNLARCYEDSKNIPDAIRCYEATLKTRPGWKDAIRDFSELLIKGQKNKEAQDLVEKSIKLHPTDGDLMCILGRIFLNQFDYDNASKTFKKADSVKPNDIKILTGFSQALEKGDNISAALEKALEASEIDPNNNDVRKQYAHVLLSAQRYEQALEQVKLLDSDTNGSDPQVLDLYGQYYICRGDEASAKEYYDKIQKLNHNYKEYMLEASDRYSQIGNLDKAQDYAQQFVDRRSQSPEGYNRLGKIAIAKGDLKTAKEVFEKGQELCKPNIIASKGLAKIESELSKNPALSESPAIDIDSEKFEDPDNLIPDSFKGKVVSEEAVEKEDSAEEFDYEQMGGDTPMGEALLEKDKNFWEDFDDDENAEPEEKETEEKEEDKDEPNMSPVVKTNPDTGLPYETPKNDPSESDDLLNDLANSADDKEMSPSEIDENTDKLDDIANSLEDDSDDFDFSEFEDADDSSLEDSSSSSGTSDLTGEDAANGAEAETGEQNQPQSQFQPMEDNAQSDEDKSYMDMLPKQTNEAPKPNPEETRRPDPAQAVPPRMPKGPANYNPYENYQPPRMQPPVYDPAFDRQMQAAAMNNAVNAIEAAFMAQKMAQQLSDQQKQFEEAFTLKNEKFIQETVEKAVNEKFQKTLDEQMEKIMSAEDDDVFTSVDEYITEEKSLESDISVEESPVAEESPAVEEPAAVEESPVAEADSDESGSPAEVSLSEDPFAVVDDFATDEEPIVEESSAVEESPAVEEPAAVEESPAEDCLSEDPFAVVDDFATEEEPVIEESSAVEETAAVVETAQKVILSDEPFATIDDYLSEDYGMEMTEEESPAVEETPVEVSLSEDPFAVVDDFATDEEPVVEETAAVVEPAQKVILSDEPFATIDDYLSEDYGMEMTEEESPAVEETPVEVSLSEDPFAVVDDFATDEEPVVEETAAEEESPSAPAASSSEYKQIIKKIEEKLSDPEAAKTNAEQIELFKSLKVLASCMPDNQKDSYISCKIRMVLEYLIAKLSGRPGLLITAEALLESGVLGQEYSSKLEETSDEDLSNELIKHVITYMKKLAGQLEDSALSSALCTSADSILEKIELENSKSQIF